MRKNIALMGLATSVLVWPSITFAYIDPGTGSILIQGIIGAIAAIGVTLKLYWHRILAFFRRESTEDRVAGSTGEDGARRPD